MWDNKKKYKNNIKITIKIMRIKLDIKIKWYKMLIDEIKEKKEAIIRMRTKLTGKINEIKYRGIKLKEKINFKKALTVKQVAIKRMKIKINTNTN